MLSATLKPHGRFSLSCAKHPTIPALSRAPRGKRVGNPLYITLARLIPVLFLRADLTGQWDATVSQPVEISVITCANDWVTVYFYHSTNDFLNNRARAIIDSIELDCEEAEPGE